MNSYRSKAIFCFAAIYIIWGSTYLAILYGLETIPPLTMTAIRFFLSGWIIAVFSKIKKEEPLTVVEKKNARISGALLVFANALVCVAELWVSSGLAAVVIGAMPIWMMLVAWLGFQGERPSARKWTGAVIGLIGILLIASERNSFQGEGVFSWSILILIASNLIWAVGTLQQRKMGGLKSPFAFSRTQMLSGAWVTLILSFIFEAPWKIQWSNVTWISVLAVGYLVIFGSVIGYTAYAWLARNVEPHKISTYALVNPIIAVFLGWLFKNEIISSRFLIATLFVLAGLSILFWRKKEPGTFLAK